MDTVTLGLKAAIPGHAGELVPRPRGDGWGVDCECGWMSPTSDSQAAITRYVEHISEKTHATQTEST